MSSSPIRIGLGNQGVADPSPGIILFFSLNRLRIFIGDTGSAVRREETGGRAVGQKASLRRRERISGKPVCVSAGGGGIESGGISATALETVSKHRFIRSIAQKRFRAVGRLAANSPQIFSEGLAELCRGIGLDPQGAQGDPHRRGDADGRGAPDREIVDRRDDLRGSRCR